MRQTLWAALLTLGLCSGCSAPDAELPRAYRNLEIPVARLADPAARERGRALFVAHCAHCHGERADGHGERRAALTRPPADFTSRAWRQRTSPRRTLWIVREGLQGTPMPAWKGTLTETQSWDLVAFVLSVSQESR